jgi:hypothetical protein
MIDEAKLNTVLSQAYKRMHRYSCAEASLQALLDLWDIPKENNSWATAGYLGAILSGETTCGLLIGTSVAIGIRCGQNVSSIPENHSNSRQTAIEAVNELYGEFIEKFGHTNCKNLSQVDFRKGEEIAEYIAQKKWKSTCDVFLDFVINKCTKMVEEGRF